MAPCACNVGTVTRAPLLAILALTAAGMFGGLDGVDARVNRLEPRRQADVVNEREQRSDACSTSELRPVGALEWAYTK